MTNHRNWKEGDYRDDNGLQYTVEKKKGIYIIKNREKRIIKIDDLEAFFMEMRRTGDLEEKSQ